MIAAIRYHLLTPVMYDRLAPIELLSEILICAVLSLSVVPNICHAYLLGLIVTQVRFGCLQAQLMLLIIVGATRESFQMQNLVLE